MSKIVRLNVKISKLRRLAIVEALYFLDLEILRLVFFGLRNFSALYFLDLEIFQHCIFFGLRKFTCITELRK